MINYKSFLLCYIIGFSYFSYASAYIWDEDYTQGEAVVKKINNTDSALDYLKRFVKQLEDHPSEQMAKDLIKIVQTHIDTSQRENSGQTDIIVKAVKEAKKILEKKYSLQERTDLLNGFLKDDLFPKITSKALEEQKALEEHIKALAIVLTGKTADAIVVDLSNKTITLVTNPLPSPSNSGGSNLPPPPPPSLGDGSNIPPPLPSDSGSNLPPPPPPVPTGHFPTKPMPRTEESSTKSSTFKKTFTSPTNSGISNALKDELTKKTASLRKEKGALDIVKEERLENEKKLKEEEEKKKKEAEAKKQEEIKNKIPEIIKQGGKRLNEVSAIDLAMFLNKGPKSIAEILETGYKEDKNLMDNLITRLTTGLKKDEKNLEKSPKKEVLTRAIKNAEDYKEKLKENSGKITVKPVEKKTATIDKGSFNDELEKIMAKKFKKPQN